MVLRLQTRGDLSLSHESVWVVVRPPPQWEKKKKKASTRRTIVRAQPNLFSSLRNELTNEAMRKVSLPDRTKEWPVNFVATPRYSSVLRLSRRRRYEAKMETRDRVLPSIADWVFLRVKDPLVEVDPVTAKIVIMKEQETEGISSGNSPPSSEDETITSTRVPGIFAYLPPGFPRGSKGATLLAGIVLLITALSSAAILGLRGKQSRAPPPELDGSGPEQNGGVRVDLDGGSTDTNKNFTGTEYGDGGIKRSPVVLPTLSQSQPGFHAPVPSLSSDLHKPDYSSPQRDAFTGGGIQFHPTSEGKGDPEVMPSEDDSGSPHSGTSTLAEDISSSSSNGVTADKGPREHSIMEEVVASVVIEESVIMQSSDSPEASTEEEHVVIGDSESLGSLVEAITEEEYVLIGDSESLTSLADFTPAAHARPLADSTSSVGYATKPTTVEQAHTLGIISDAARQEGVSTGSVSFEDPDSHIQEIHAEIDADTVRKTYTEVLKKVLPAVSVGAGAAALSTLSGVDGALQMVGLLATASFITGDVMWAGRRKQLLEELCSIEDHKQFIKFLKGRDMIPDAWNQ